MKNFKLVLMIFLISFLSANSIQGHKTYSKSLQKYCKISAYEFAQKYEPKQWKTFFEKKQFLNKVLEICPKLDNSILEKVVEKNIFDFVYKYGKNSGNVPL